jgi:hypothetical protein
MKCYTGRIYDFDDIIGPALRLVCLLTIPYNTMQILVYYVVFFAYFSNDSILINFVSNWKLLDESVFLILDYGMVEARRNKLTEYPYNLY